MVEFKAVIKKFGNNAEKYGWVYLEIAEEFASRIKPGYRRSFRVKGKIDNLAISQTSLLPAGDGNFILPLNKSIRKQINKSTGSSVTLKLYADDKQPEIFPDLLICLAEEPEALKRFRQLPPSHQRYFSKWITDAKTENTRTVRIARTLTAMLNNLSFGEAVKMDRL